MTLYRKRCGPDYHLADAFVYKNVAYGYEVRKYTADAILFREIQGKRSNILMFLTAFQCVFG